MTIPKRVLAIGGLMTLEGLHGLYILLQGFLGTPAQDSPIVFEFLGLGLNLSLILLPLGIGILFGKPLARTILKVLFWICVYIPSGFGIVIASFLGILEGDPRAFIFITLIVILPAVCYGIQKILYSDRANSYFEGIP
jgi:hypothetical protein